jgi:hypothetical protein
MKKKKQYIPETGCDLYNVEVPPTLIDPFLPAGCLGGLSGGPGVGKSWFALEACRAVATGTPFLGKFDVTTSVPVLFIGSDSSKFDYGRCWKKLTKKQYEAIGGEKREDDHEGNLTSDLNPLNDRVRFIIGSDFSLDDDEKVEAMIAAVDYEWGPDFYEEEDVDDDGKLVPGGWQREHGAGLIVMDTFGSLTEEDLIDNSAMIRVYQRLRRFVAKTNATVLLLNHNPHARASWLGAISQVGKLDFWLNLQKSKYNEYRISVQFKKVRGIKPSQGVTYRMNVSDPVEASLVVEAPLPTLAEVDQPASEGALPASADWTMVLDLVKNKLRTMKELVVAKQTGDNAAENEETARTQLRRTLLAMVSNKAIIIVPRTANTPTKYGPAPSANGMVATPGH